MKRTIFSILMCLAVALVATAQERRGKFNPEEFRARMESFITGEAGFTAAEAQAFYPVFYEMKDKQRQLQHSIFELKKNAPSANTSDKDYETTVVKITLLNVEIAQIGATYYKKMCKAAPARKVYLAMCAEDKFHRQMLSGFNKGQKNKNK